MCTNRIEMMGTRRLQVKWSGQQMLTFGAIGSTDSGRAQLEVKFLYPQNPLLLALGELWISVPTPQNSVQTKQVSPRAGSRCSANGEFLSSPVKCKRYSSCGN